VIPKFNFKPKNRLTFNKHAHMRRCHRSHSYVDFYSFYRCDLRWFYPLYTVAYIRWEGGLFIAVIYLIYLCNEIKKITIIFVNPPPEQDWMYATDSIWSKVIIYVFRIVRTTLPVISILLTARVYMRTHYTYSFDIWALAQLGGDLGGLSPLKFFDYLKFYDNLSMG
jgi:hypothetical protein